MASKYRKLWIKHYGEIPHDEFGISYEIHHIDGNHSNNNIENLMCVSLIDHFLIHLFQNDFAAANRILTKIKNVYSNVHNFNLTPKQLSQFMAANKLGVWSDESKLKSLETRRKKQIGFCHDKKLCSKGGKNGGSKGNKAAREIMKKNKTGIYSKQHQSNAGKIGGRISGLSKKGEKKPLVTCPHCGKAGGGQALMNRWHFNNCKLKLNN